MKIKKKSIVILHYSIANSDGKLLETTQNGPPAQFICGTGLFIPGFEDELIGLKAGDKKTIIISPEKGYGNVKEELILKVHRSDLPETDIKVGGTLWRESSHSEKIPFKINGFLDDWVFLDGNHPWADYELHYHVTILSVRDNEGLDIRIT